MSWIITQYLITAFVVVVVSEAAKRSDRLGGPLAALPLMTVFGLIWLHVEKRPPAKLANHACPFLLPRLGFWPTMLASAMITLVCFGITAVAVRPFGIQLLP